MRKIRDKVCFLCKQKISSVVCATSSNCAFWCANAISDAKVVLFVPSSGLTNVLEQMEERYVRLIDSRMFISGIKSLLISSFMKSVDWGSMVYNSCRLPSLIAGLMVNTIQPDCATPHWGTKETGKTGKSSSSVTCNHRAHAGDVFWFFYRAHTAFDVTWCRHFMLQDANISLAFDINFRHWSSVWCYSHRMRH